MRKLFNLFLAWCEAVVSEYPADGGAFYKW